MVIGLTRERVLSVSSLVSLLELDRQASHSATTGQSHYARTPADHQSSNSVMELHFFYISTIWHQMLGTSLHINTPIGHPSRQPHPFPAPINSAPRPLAPPNLNPDPNNLVVDSTSTLTYLRVLRQLLGDAYAGFRERQLKAIHAAHLGADVLWIEATGGGKTMAIAIPAQLASAMTVVVVPQVALLMEMVIRLAALRPVVYQDSRHLQDPLPKVLLVSPKEVAKKAFQDRLAALANQGLISRIVLDEAHLFVTQDFRAEMKGALSLCRLGVPLTLLTATLPPYLQATLQGDLSLTYTTVVIRGDTRRPNLGYYVHEFRTQKDALQAVGYCLKQATDAMGDEDRVMIFTLDVSEAKDVQKALEIPILHGSMKPEEKAEALETWRVTPKGVIVGTSAMGVGIDHPHVRRVIIVGGMRSVIDFLQASGRAGRDGQHSDIFVLTAQDYEDRFKWETREHWEVREFWNFVHCEGCRSQHLHGADTPPCLANPKENTLCDNCASKSSLFIVISRKQTIICLSQNPIATSMCLPLSPPHPLPPPTPDELHCPRSMRPFTRSSPTVSFLFLMKTSATWRDSLAKTKTTQTTPPTRPALSPATAVTTVAGLVTALVHAQPRGPMLLMCASSVFCPIFWEVSDSTVITSLASAFAR